MKAVIIGAGNVAHHLALALNTGGFEIVQVFSRTEKSAKILADKLNTAYTSNIENVLSDADVYFYLVSDGALTEVISQIKAPNALHIHSSGSTPISVFEGLVQRYGVLYPLQTFSKEKEVDFGKIPVFIEASNEKEKELIAEIAAKLTKSINFVDSENRKKLHLSAVFVCNFVNHLYTIGTDLVEDTNCSFDVLLPLIVETADKIKMLKPYDAQTGPAVRNDKITINKQLALLEDKKDLAELYRLLSNDIYRRHQKGKWND